MVFLCIHTSGSFHDIFLHFNAVFKKHKIAQIHLFVGELAVSRVHLTILAIVDHSMAVCGTWVSDKITAVTSLISCTAIARE